MSDIRSRLFGEGPSKRQRTQIQRTVDFMAAFNARDLKTLRSFFAEKHVDRTFFGHEAIDRDSKLRMFAGMFETFPDWKETLDELVPTEKNQMVIRHTGRGTQEKAFLGRQATGRQLAATYIDIVTFDDDDRIIEYKTGQFPFTSFFEEHIVGAENVMETRAEQGGNTISSATRSQLYSALTDSTIEAREFQIAKSAAEPLRRCEALLETNLRRCLNEAKDGSHFCEIHQHTGWGPAAIADIIK
ncbi:MAG: ester cyclase [Xanthobacteraceae bacterium]